MLLKDVPTGSIDVGGGGPGHSDRSHGFQPLSDDEASPSHRANLVGRLDLESVATQHVSS